MPALRKVSLIHLPKASLDGGLKGQEVVKNNFVIDHLYGLVSSKCCSFTSYCLLFSLAESFSFSLWKCILHICNRSSILIPHASSEQNSMLQMSVTGKISLAICSKETDNRVASL